MVGSVQQAQEGQRPDPRVRDSAQVGQRLHLHRRPGRPHLHAAGQPAGSGRPLRTHQTQPRQHGAGLDHGREREGDVCASQEVCHDPVLPRVRQEDHGRDVGLQRVSAGEELPGSIWWQLHEGARVHCTQVGAAFQQLDRRHDQVPVAERSRRQVHCRALQN